MQVQVVYNRARPAFREFRASKEGSPSSLEAAEASGRASQSRDSSQTLSLSRLELGRRGWGGGVGAGRRRRGKREQLLHGP